MSRIADWLDDDQDERFSLWYRRYLEGDWNVENGPAFQLVAEIKLINGLSREVVGTRLFAIDEPNIAYPAAQNTHRYEDAHRELYGILSVVLQFGSDRCAALRNRVWSFGSEVRLVPRDRTSFEHS